MFMHSGIGNNPDTSLAFLADPVSITITATTQRVLVSSSKALGSALFFEGAKGLNLYVCHQGDGALVTDGPGVFGLSVHSDTRQLFTLSATVTGLEPGTYTFGLCGFVPDPNDAGNWNSNEFSYTTALVAQ
jgi:hypothetical protein